MKDESALSPDPSGSKMDIVGGVFVKEEDFFINVADPNKSELKLNTMLIIVLLESIVPTTKSPELVDNLPSEVIKTVSVENVPLSVPLEVPLLVQDPLVKVPLELITIVP